jgi:TetR/AcrR family transcriptional regulator
MELRTPKLPAGERRAATIEAVIDLAADCDPGEITTTAIASHMQLTQGALFRHFASKEAIWEAVMGWVAERLLARIDSATQAAPSPLEALEAAFMTHVGFISEHPGVPRIMFGELQRGADSPAKRMVRILVERYSERLRRLVEAGKAGGQLSPDIDTAAAAMLFLSTLQGLVMQSLLAGDVKRIRRAAPGAFALYARAIRRSP